MTVLAKPHQRAHHRQVLFPGCFFWGDSEIKHFKTHLLSCWVLGFHEITQGDTEYHLIIEGPFIPLNWKTERQKTETFSGHLEFVLK